MNSTVSRREVAIVAEAPRGEAREPFERGNATARPTNGQEKEPIGLRTVIDWVLGPPDTAPRSTILIRCMVGGVFLSEGILKFVYTNQGVGRFTKLGFPAPALRCGITICSKRCRSGPRTRSFLCPVPRRRS